MQSDDQRKSYYILGILLHTIAILLMMPRPSLSYSGYKHRSSYKLIINRQAIYTGPNTSSNLASDHTYQRVFKTTILSNSNIISFSDETPVQIIAFRIIQKPSYISCSRLQGLAFNLTRSQTIHTNVDLKHQ